MIVLAVAWSAANSWGAEKAGDVVRVQNDAPARAPGAERRLSKAAPVFATEELRTGPKARLLVKLGDGTDLTLGEGARVLLEDFVFDRSAGRSETALRVLAGAFRVVTASLRAGQARTLSVTTPFATIGIRGTDFWGGPLDGAFQVFLVRGVVEVSNAAGTVVLDAPGQGTTVGAPGAAPAAPIFWSDAKRDRAFATVTFQ